MTTTRIIGLLGPAGAGKSSVAEFLEQEYGVERYSLAAPLKEIARRTLDFTEAQVYGTQAEKEAVDPRYGFSPRWFLQRLGTEGIRHVLSADVWVKLCLDRIKAGTPAVAVIEDVRFINEVDAIRFCWRSAPDVSIHGEVWRLESPGREAVTTADASHASEAEWSQAPYDVLIRPKKRGLEELFALVRLAYLRQGP